MTRYKALISIMVIAVVAVATITWSPQIADAREVAQEGDRLVPLDPPLAASLDVAPTELLPATCSPSPYKMGVYLLGDEEESGPEPSQGDWLLGCHLLSLGVGLFRPRRRLEKGQTCVPL